MGWARIVDGGPTGRYTIELDWGESTRTAVLAALGARVAELDAKLVIAEAKVIAADAQEATLRAEVTAQMNAYIAASTSLPPGATRPDSSGFKNSMALLTKIRQANAGLRLTVDKLKFERAVALDRVSFWTNFNPTETRQAWCASLAEDVPAGALVATLDIKGESDLIVIAPEGRGWNPSDGVLTAREMMSPEQAFWNAAALPGWQKWKPTYRWGTVTAINFALDKMDVALGEANSSAQRLNVNQASALAAVPVIYGTCHSKAFKVGDRVIVQFQGQAWTQPVVIGFLDNPRGCDWMCIGTRNAFPLFATTRQASIDFLFANWSSLSVHFKASTFGSTWINLKDPSSVPAELSVPPYNDFTDIDADYISLRRTYMAPSWSGTIPLASADDAQQMYLHIFRPAFIPGALPTGYLGGIFFNWQNISNQQMVDNIAEVRIMLGSDVIFNAATRVPVVDGDINREVRSRSGSQYLIGGYYILPLNGYTLYSEAPA